MSKTILITGGLGYVGGRVSKFLAENTDYNLIITDINQKTLKPNWLENGKIVHLDLASEKINEVCNGVDCIIHLAAINEIESGENPQKALLINSLGSLKLLISAEENNVKRFIYFSTAHVYGSPLVGDIDEEKLTRPVHPYSITHKVAEDFILALHDKKKIEAVVLRMSNSFGAPIDPNVNRWTLLVNDLCRQAVTTKKMVLKSSGLQVRDFIPLNDVCRAIQHFITIPKDKLNDGIFNLGGEKTYSILEMTQLIAERCNVVLGFYPEIKKEQQTTNDKTEGLKYSINKLRATGFSPMNDFNEEIDNTLVFCNEHFSK
mgnify:CR=1 FL=1